MQRVERLQPNVSPIMDEIDTIYAYLSDFPSPSLIKPTYDESFRELIDTFNAWGDCRWSVGFSDDGCYTQLEELSNNKVILCFSGGKDSIAAAMRYREQGFDVYLYHMRHINPSFADEWECAKKTAEILEMPIYFDDIKFKGYHKWTEHPMKNMLIANGALSYGVREGITTNIAFGNYITSYLEDNVFDRCAGDCMDMWDSYNAIIQKVLPNFKMMAILDNMGDTLDTLADRRDLLDMSLSCLCRHSLRDYRRQWVKDTFGIELFNHRCGSCYKCCVEYIYMADNGKMPFSEDYYKYCLDKLYKVAIIERVPVFSLYSLWEHFIFYPIQKSKIFDKLMDAHLLKKSIKW